MQRIKENQKVQKIIRFLCISSGLNSLAFFDIQNFDRAYIYTHVIKLKDSISRLERFYDHYAETFKGINLFLDQKIDFSEYQILGEKNDIDIDNWKGFDYFVKSFRELSKEFNEEDKQLLLEFISNSIKKNHMVFNSYPFNRINYTSEGLNYFFYILKYY